MTLSKEQAKFAADAARFITHIFASGYTVTFGDAYRSPEQAALDAKEGKGIVHSLHCERLALDLNLFDDQGNYITGDHPAWRAFGTYWKFMDDANRWGGDFERKDFNHIERNAK